LEKGYGETSTTHPRGVPSGIPLVLERDEAELGVEGGAGPHAPVVPHWFQLARREEEKREDDSVGEMLF